MRLKEPLIAAFKLLRDRPILFIPKIVISTLWSFLWIYLLQHATTPTGLQSLPAGLLLAAVVGLSFLQIWVYNSYFAIVEQYHADDIRLLTAFKQGLSTMPRGIAVFILLIFISTILAFPGLLIAAIGQLTGDFVLYLTGLGIAIVILLIVTIAFYFVPVSVILGDNSFLQDIKTGFAASTSNLQDVSIISIASFGVLILTGFLEGFAETAGTVSFFLLRYINSIVGVYLLIVNPEMLFKFTD